MSFTRNLISNKTPNENFQTKGGGSEKYEIVIVGDPEASKGKFVANLLGKKKIDPTAPLIKFIALDALRYQLNFTLSLGNEKSYAILDHVSRQANAFIFLYDVSLRHTFTAFERWREVISSGNDDARPVLLVGYAPSERAKDRRCISAQEAKLLADSYGFNQKDIDYDGDMNQLHQRLVADIRRDHLEALDDASETPIIEVAILGDSFVGKTSLLHRLTNGEFLKKYSASQTTRPKKVKVIIDDILTILKIRDVPGSVLEEALTPEYMNGIHAAMIVYDVTNLNSFLLAQQIHQNLLRCKQEKKISIILIGNKNDDQFIIPRQVEFDKGFSIANQWRCPFIETSIKNNNVDGIFKEMVRETRLIFNYDTIPAAKMEWSGIVSIHNGTKFQKKWMSCKAGKLSWGTKQDSVKSLKTIEITSDVGVIEGHYDKGFLLLLSAPNAQALLGITGHVQILLSSNAERAALADVLFAEIALQRLISEIMGDVLKGSIKSLKTPIVAQESILASKKVEKRSAPFKRSSFRTTEASV